MDPTKQLHLVREKLQSQIRVLQGEVEALDKTLKVLQREDPEAAMNRKELRTLGTTDAIRRLIGSEFITPHTIRDQLILGGFPCRNGKQKLLNIVWATMKRLGKSRTSGFEIGQATDGKFALRRKASPHGANLLPLVESEKAVQ